MSSPIGESPRVSPRVPSSPPSITDRVSACSQAALDTTTALLSALVELHFSDQLRASCLQLSSGLRTRGNDPETVKQVFDVVAQVQQAVRALAGAKNALADVHVATSAAMPPFTREPLQALITHWQNDLETLLIHLPLSAYVDDPLLLRAIDEADQSMQVKKMGLPLEAQQEFDAFEKELSALAPLICASGLREQWGIGKGALAAVIDPQIEALRSRHPILKWGDLAGHSSITDALLSLKRASIRKMDQLHHKSEIAKIVQREK